MSKRPDFDLRAIVRTNVYSLDPYRCARDDYDQGILLDANENSIGAAVVKKGDDDELTRYPSPYQVEMKRDIAAFRSIQPDQIFLGVGSDEAIDTLVRIFCVPGKDALLITPPTYGMYKVVANMNDVKIQSVPLTPDFQINVEETLKAITPETKIVFLCSPNNPTGNLLATADIIKVLDHPALRGVVVLDEAYVDFTTQGSLAHLLASYPNLVIMQTFSKSFGLAGVRLGMAFASAELTAIMNKFKAPYNINQLTSQVGVQAVSQQGLAQMRSNVAVLLEQRALLEKEFKAMPQVAHVFPSDSNFLLVRFTPSVDAYALYKKMADSGVVVRFRGNEIHCKNCLRVTVGSPSENQELLRQVSALAASPEMAAK
ncbi:histidinol-phosphate aminotransferase [Capsaspora owczarzaki ATCC 30864]|uniref:histidinol-phosphate transaminase n=1 Tax=Capsaspora owczarzaki (strain ATCC 30864) TaxID=595528 RepID=A0A0D2W127_CAPO3|nr:histidinol-phosphate aminotransferase [Capsaspora owczarzaki ATCC 30864]KJE97962.1 histidinol-phosphate aminotransferase [Capsaspora owczarzaki ATCC 30864]|eukprot:XP_004342628.1 histidinol-phosphate aminotransferase [Capsaspora owczarzaki ATCC 30864]